MRLVIFVNGMVVLFVAALMAVDAAIFPATAPVFIPAAAISGLTGGLIALAVQGDRRREFRRSHTFLLTSTVWLSAAAAGALPLFLWKLSAVDALFESVSAVTTTGSTVMTGLDTTPHGILMWRAILQALGGIGFVVAGMALLPVLRVGGMQLFRTESSDRSDKEFGTATHIAGATLAIYLGLILLCVIVYLEGGMSTFDAVTHAFTTLSTGGFSNYDSSFGHFDSAYLQWSATFFMLLGGLPFMWYLRIATRGKFRNEQVSAMLASIAIVIVLMTLWLMETTGRGPGEALRLVAFNVVSIVTTTGYATTDYTAWGPLAMVVFFGLTAVGGCTGSTAGGAKAMRWIIMARAIVVGVRRVRFPHGLFTIRYEGRRVAPDVLDGVVSFFTFYIVTVAVLAAALSLMGLDMDTALSGALTSLANVGPGVGDVIGPSGNFASLDDGAKILLALGMYAGRLEMLTVFILFLPRFWRDV